MTVQFRQGWREWPHIIAITYTLVGWAAGIWLMLRPQLTLNAIGVILTAHALVYSAYLVHECAHHCVFVGAAPNDRLGILMCWINGACVADYAQTEKETFASSFRPPRRRDFRLSCRPGCGHQAGCEVLCLRWSGPMYLRLN